MSLLKSSLLALLYCIVGPLVAQTNVAGNEWVQPGALYIKLEVVEDAIYRVTANDTRLLSFAPGNPNFFHLYYRGQEVPLFVINGGNLSSFDGGDFFEFYGKQNDGAIEAEMFKDLSTGLPKPKSQTNDRHSLFSDTSAYFLTWDITTPGLRYSVCTDNDYVALVPRTHYRHTYFQNFSLCGSPACDPNYRFAAGGSYNQNTVLNSDYIGTEGYSSVSTNLVSTYNLPTDQIYSGSGALPARMCMRIAGASEAPKHVWEIQLGGRKKINTFAPQLGIGVTVDTLFASSSDLSNGITSYTITPKAPSPQPFYRLSWLELIYDRQFNFSAEKSVLMGLSNLGNRTLLRMNGLGTTGGDSVLVYDLHNFVRSRATVTGSVAQAILPKVTSDTIIALTITGSQVKSPVGIRLARISGFAASNTGAEFVIVTHRKFANSAQKYAQYRDTNSVNRLSAKVVFVDELYDEFGYGSITPLAIKRAIREASENWVIKPKHVLLWGKGSYKVHGVNYNYVPTWNAPASDHEFVSNFNPAVRNIVPDISVGRVCIQNDDQGLVYLNKINQYEHTPFADWMKNCVLLGGGANLQEQIVIRQYLLNYGAVWKACPLNGGLTTQFKTSNTAVDPTTNSSVRDAINGGSTIIDFFGHSTSEIFDVEIDEASRYNNFGKYPFIIANGCYTGDYASYSTTYGERFMLEASNNLNSNDSLKGYRGCIGYLSSTTNGFLDVLGVYNDFFFKVAFRDSLGAPIGRLVDYTIQKMMSVSGTQQSTINHCRTINLQCDPALRLYHPPKPDLSVTENSINIISPNYTATSDSFIVRVGVRSRGTCIATTDSFNIQLRITAPNGSLLSAPIRRKSFSNTDSINFVIRPTGVDISGVSTLELTVDVNNELSEITKVNNVARREFFIPSLLPALLYPTEYAVIKYDTISLQAAVFGTSATRDVTFEFEIDTVNTFSSPLWLAKGRSGAVTGPSWQVKWELPFQLADQTVYYWRVRLAGNANAPWATSSFQYRIGLREGWAQARPQQYFNINGTEISINPNSLLWEFAGQRKKIIARTAPGNITLFNAQNDEEGITKPLTADGVAGLLYTVIDGVNLRTQTYNPNLGNIDVLEAPQPDLKLPGIINSMKKGDYIVILDNGNANVQGWSNAAFDALNEVGVSNEFRQLGSSQLFCLLGRKGDSPGLAHEILSPNALDKNGFVTQYYLEEPLVGPGYRGIAKSKTVGPASVWHTLSWDYHSLEQGSSDVVQVNLYGIRSNGIQERLISTTTPNEFDLSSYSATTYPNMRLEAVLKDSLLRTSPQLDNWYLYYTPVPDVAVESFTDFVFQGDTVEEGQLLNVQLFMHNLTVYPMDSVLVDYEVTNNSGETSIVLSKRFAPLPANGGYSFAATVPTRGLTENNLLTVRVNPRNDQPERNTFNNVYSRPFFVRNDITNPILDVTFDGRHIRDGEIVSPTPTIVIQTKDENPYFFSNDTSDIDVFLKFADYPGPSQKVYYNGGRLAFTPADAQTRSARAVFTPAELTDTTYLLEVQTYDVAGNASGESRYRIMFRVVAEQTLSDIICYPNPFSDFTRFSYLLTGKEIPEKFLIQVYHPSGRLVKTIDLKALNEVFIGQYTTKYSWDGRDDNGDLVANGIYSYKVLVEMPGGKPIRIRNSTTGQYFPYGWGKISVLH
jgi:hypothetical protein